MLINSVMQYTFGRLGLGVLRSTVECVKVKFQKTQKWLNPVNTPQSMAMSGVPVCDALGLLDTLGSCSDDARQCQAVPGLVHFSFPFCTWVRTRPLPFWCSLTGSHPTSATKCDAVDLRRTIPRLPKDCCITDCKNVPKKKLVCPSESDKLFIQ